MRNTAGTMKIEEYEVISLETGEKSAKNKPSGGGTSVDSILGGIERGLLVYTSISLLRCLDHLASIRICLLFRRLARLAHS